MEAIPFQFEAFVVQQWTVGGLQMNFIYFGNLLMRIQSSYNFAHQMNARFFATFLLLELIAVSLNGRSMNIARFFTISCKFKNDWVMKHINRWSWGHSEAEELFFFFFNLNWFHSFLGSLFLISLRQLSRGCKTTQNDSKIMQIKFCVWWGSAPPNRINQQMAFQFQTRMVSKQSNQCGQPRANTGLVRAWLNTVLVCSCRFS